MSLLLQGILHYCFLIHRVQFLRERSLPTREHINKSKPDEDCENSASQKFRENSEWSRFRARKSSYNRLGYRAIRP